MDANRFRQAYQKLQALDQLSTYKIRPRSGALSRLSVEQLEERHRDLASYTISLKEVVHELFEAIAGKSSQTAD